MWGVGNISNSQIWNPPEKNIKPYGLKTYWQDKEYIIETIDDSLEFKPLSELLSRNRKPKQR